MLGFVRVERMGENRIVQGMARKPRIGVQRLGKTLHEAWLEAGTH